MSGFNPRYVAGKTIDHVDMQPFNADQFGPNGEELREGQGRQAHDPMVYFTDGSRMRFITEETEVGTYGTDILYIPAPKQNADPIRPRLTRRALSVLVSVLGSAEAAGTEHECAETADDPDTYEQDLARALAWARYELAKREGK